MAKAMLIVAMTFASNSVWLSHASEFLQRQPTELEDRVNVTELRANLIAEIEGALGEGSTSKRVHEIELQLKPIYTALPKNAHGNLEHSTVRYALHRLFVLRHGWLVKGLGKGKSADGASSPASILQDQVPGYVEDLFEERLKGQGFRLHELAILAATIEHLIHSQADDKLEAVFDSLGVSKDRLLTEPEASSLLDTYMMGHILGENVSNLTYDETVALVTEMPDLFTGWNQTREFVRSVQAEIVQNRDMNFAVLANVVEVVGERHGSFQDAECFDLKKTLMQMEHPGTGRVRLVDFYKPALGGAWQFQENVGYLRQLGALDESNPKELSVIISNYVLSQTNCIAASGMYSVCCKDECESLFAQVEKRIAAPEAKPDQLASIISGLSSSTVQAPLELSATLVQRLHDIAKTHKGVVPIHGRLFAQWMHHVYPRECPFPHVSGTATQQTAQEWMEENGVESIATEEEMLQYVSLDANSTDENATSDFCIPWNSEEELLVARTHVQSRSQEISTSVLRSLALLAASFSLAFSLMQTLKRGMVDLREADIGKVMV